MNRERALVLAVSLALIVAVWWSREKPGAIERTNFVVLIADDLGWSDVGAYGNPDVYTPHIDQLAERGLRFTNAFLTTSSCSASRASILTGRYPHSNGLYDLHDSLPAQEQTLAAHLGAEGYYTAAVGKWHIGPAPKRQFDLVIEDRGDSGTDQWLEALRARPLDQPFFFWLASRDPHRPFDGGAEFSEHYDSRALTLPDGFVEGPGVRRELEHYYREISRFDADVGRVLAELERQGVSDNTLVVVMSDNGRPFHGAKTLIYDDGIKTPLIFYWPSGIVEAGEYHGLVSAVDLAPTLLDLSGSAPAPAMQGLSMLEIMNDRSATLREHVFAERNRHGKPAHERVVRSLDYMYKENQFPLIGDCLYSGYKGTASYKAILASYERGSTDATFPDCFAEQRPARELFAISEQGQILRENLALDAQHAEALTHLQSVLATWRSATNDFDFAERARDD